MDTTKNSGPQDNSEDLQYKTLIQTIPDVMYEIDIRGKFTFVSDAIRDFGYQPKELIGQHFETIIYADDLPRVSRDVVLPEYQGKVTGDEHSPKLFDERRTGKRMTKNLEIRLKLKVPKNNQDFCYVEIHSCGKWMQNGNEKVLAGSIGIMRDITKIQQAQEMLQKSYAMTQEILKHAPFGVWVVNDEGMVEYVNPAMVDISGDTYEQFKGTNIFNCVEYQKTELYEKIQELLNKGESFFLNYCEFTAACSKKTTLVNFYGIPLKEENTVKALLFTEDLTGIKQAGEALQLKDKAMDSSINAIVMADLEGSLTYVNTTFLSMLGFASMREVIDHPFKDFVSSEAQIQKMIDAVRNKGSWVGELKARRKDLSALDCQVSSNMVKDEAGNPVCIMVSLIDISEQKRIEAQLLQSQKMETIGRLAGGVAHDFNNLLTAMMNYATLAKYRIKPEEPAQEDLDQIIKVAKRAANLTHQLLSFSRRQIISLKPVHINDFVLNMDKMLRRLIREEIELVVIPQETGFANADVGQLEQILVNLVVNARDAITAKGKITVTMGNVKFPQGYSDNNIEIDPGDYVWLSVKDTGSGMDEHVKKHLFEPFFTTKEVGKGTGLGLATVYGIVKQHQGNIEAISEVGQGTEMKIYLPQVFNIQADMGSAGKDQKVMRGRETIFVVEDEALVRDAVVRILEKLGYKVFSAGNGPEAMALAEEHSEKIDLLLADVVMPQMSGIELSRKFKIIYPGIKILLVSGYTDDMSVASGLDKSQGFLQKPFTEDILAQKLRDLLD